MAFLNPISIVVRTTLLGLVASAACFAQLTSFERDFALSNLYASEKLFLDSVEGLSPAQLNFKAAPNRWSIAECAEHITLAEDYIFLGVITNGVMKTPLVANRKVTLADDEKILAAMANRSKKFPAPEPIQPTAGRFASVEEAVAHFRESRARLLDYVRTSQDDLRHHVLPHPAGFTLDGYQWILMLSGHTERHVAQIQEVKADPNFPRN